MGVPQRVGNLAHQAQDQVGGDLCLGPESLLEGVAPYERHDEEADPLPCVEVIDAHDVGVVERRAESRLAAEPLVAYRARRDVGGEHLHRHDVTERAVAGAEHRAHAADTGEAQYLVTVADGALHGLEVWCLHESRRMYLRLPAAAACPILGGTMPSVSCRVLGPVRVTVAGADAPAELLWRKHVALLVYLARSPRKSRTREHLIGLLWSDRDERQARHSLIEALRVLRRVLGDARVHASVDQVGLTADAVALDCDRFADLCARGDWTAAAALVEGEFLEGLAIPEASEFENWLVAERAFWRTQALEALVTCAEGELVRGEAAAAARAGLRAVRFYPTSETAARAAMRALALTGDRAGAVHVADGLARALHDVLDARPSAETGRLLERIREARVGRRLLAAAPTGRPRPPLCGRASELKQLGRAWDRARRERMGQVVLVEGEPGEGKSRLIEELTSRARLDEATIVVARAVPADQAKV